MTKLASNYARVSGLKIDEPNVKEKFYALPFEKYVTVQSGSGQAAKNYDFWNEVIPLIKGPLGANKISIVHLGGSDDPALSDVYDLRGKTSILQANYLLKNSLLHFGSDSWQAHCAGWHRRPLVALYGNTSSWNHGPYWFNKEKTVLIDSHRSNGVPTYAQEPAKTINLIDPYRVAESILGLLDFNEKSSLSSRHWGPAYNHLIVEVIPNTFVDQTVFVNAPFVIRLDKHHNENNLIQILQTGRKVNIVTAQPINLAILTTFKPQIISYNHEMKLDSLPPDTYISSVRSVLPKAIFFTKETDSEKQAKIRAPYYPDTCNNIEFIKDTTIEDYLSNTLTYINKEKTEANKLELKAEIPHLRFKTSRYVLSDNKVYLGYAQLEAGLNITDQSQNKGSVLDSALFWNDLNYCHIYYDGSNDSRALSPSS